MLQEFLSRTSCQQHCPPHLGGAICNIGEGARREGEGNKTGRRVVVGHWFCQVKGNDASAKAPGGCTAAAEEGGEEADKSEPTQTGGRPPLGRRGVSRDTEIALELQRKVEIGVIM